MTKCGAQMAAAEHDIRYRVADAARAAGIAPSTLRLWEAQGLITPERRNSGQRLYSSADVERIQRIAFLRREAGLNPAAIRAALDAEAQTALGGRNELPESLPGDGLGPRLRALRQARGLRMDQVAQDLGLSPSSLSTLERTGAGVSFTTLAGVARYYGTTVSLLSGQDRPGGPVVRAGAARIWPMPVEGVRVEVLAEGRLQMDCHRFILSPGAGSEGVYGHEGEEFIHVLAGRFRLVLDGTETHELGPGDSLYFKSARPHSWANAADEECVLIWVNTPPSF